MKDYYYVLGVKQSASIEQIKRAYRKLSHKFHPDKNDGDEFFTERFKEIQEAYETLSEPLKRNGYDIARTNNSYSGSDNFQQNFPLEIEYFRTSKSYFEFCDEITFSWKTINSNKVTLKPLEKFKQSDKKHIG
jgi:DnaJ-class molecular chaperone